MFLKLFSFFSHFLLFFFFLKLFDVFWMWFFPYLLVEILLIFFSLSWFWGLFFHSFSRWLFVKEMIRVLSSFFWISFLFFRFCWCILLGYFRLPFIQLILIVIFFFVQLSYTINIFLEICLLFFFKFLFLWFAFGFLFLWSLWWMLFKIGSFYLFLFNFFSKMVVFTNTLPIVSGVINVIVIDQISRFVIFIIIFFDFAKWVTAEKLWLCLYHCFVLNTFLLLLCHFTKLTFSNFFLFRFSIL